ncbi:MAG: hypothetical protein AMS14_08655 [Planctomycetes bacterium DG_20]|nr:MAG: hypothetical protein AMS14_08655 [Planctomycetes bacterium DG_20]
MAVVGAGCGPEGPETLEPPVVWGGFGADAGRFDRPRAIACAPDGSVYVADLADRASVRGHEKDLFVSPRPREPVFDGRIQKFDPAGKLVQEWRLAPFDAGKPAGLAVAPNGDLLVGETHHHRVSRYSPQGQLLLRWGAYGREAGQFLLIRDLTCDPKGNAYVVDYGYIEAVGLVSRLQRFTPDGHITTIGKPGSAPGELDRPEGVALDAEGNIYVCESGNHRVQVFSPAGEFLRAWGGHGEQPGQFNKPYDIDVSADGYVYVADRDNHRVQVFTGDGKLVAVWGSLGTSRRHLASPWGVAVDRTGACFICDTGNQRVVKVRLRLPGITTTRRGR